MESITAYLTYSECAGAPFPPEALRRFVAQFSWERLFARLAAVAAALANDNTPQSYALEVEAALPGMRLASPNVLLAAQHARANPGRRFVHEQAVYFLEALAILDGGPADGREPNHGELGALFLWANDYLAVWRQPDRRTLTEEEQFMAEICHIARFNQQPDPLRELVRAHRIFTRVPQHGRLADLADLERVERTAFWGERFGVHFREVVVPFFLVAAGWGLRDAAGQIRGSTVSPAIWLRNTALAPDRAHAALADLTTNRDDARGLLREHIRADGLPYANAIFVSKPLVQFADGTAWGASPGMVREHLRGGLWRRMRDATEREIGNAAQHWMPSFGQMFELAARDVASASAAEARFGAQLVLSRAIGDETEVEDVVLIDEDVAMLGSAKSRLVRQRVAREAVSRDGLVDWYEDFLFRDADHNHRAGALRLLAANVARVRAGTTNVRRDAKVFPVLVTFDDLGENAVLNSWIDARCRALGLFQGPDVAPPLITDLDGLESLLALVAHGAPLRQLLATKASVRRGVTLDTYLRELNPDGTQLRLPAFAAEFDALVAESQQVLFPQ